MVNMEFGRKGIEKIISGMIKTVTTYLYHKYIDYYL